MKQKKENFLDYLPRRNSLYDWNENEDKRVEICVPNRGFFCRIAQVFFHTAKETKVELDLFGSFIWRQLDGKKNIYEVGKLLKQEFGAEAEPLYERLVSFIRILYQNHLIMYENYKKYTH